MDSFEQQWQRWFPEEEKPSPPRRQQGTATRVLLTLGGILLLFIILNIVKDIYTEWLWFGSLDYSSVYTTIVNTRVLAFLAAGIIAGILIFGNLTLAARLLSPNGTNIWPWAIMTRIRRAARLAMIL